MEYRHEYRYGIWVIDLGYGISTCIYHMLMVIWYIDMGHGQMIWEMTVCIRSSAISIWDILSP